MMRKTSFLFCLSALCCFEMTAQKNPGLSPTQKQQTIDSLIRYLDHYYIFPDKARKMSDLLRLKQRDHAYEDITEPEEFAGRITADIRQIYPDRHLSLRYDPELEKRIKTYTSSTGRVTDIRNEQNKNFFFQKAEVLNGNIGYVLFNNFATLNKLSRRTVRAALEFVMNSKALILDLRNNSGGSPEMATEIAGYFFKTRQLTGNTFNRITGKEIPDYIPTQIKKRDGFYLDMPIYVLTGKRTFSAAEGLAYNLKYLRHAVIVGDTTAGGAHAARSFAMGNGFACFIPFTRSENIITHTDWEGKGVTPDAYISENFALPKAQEIIFSDALTAESDSLEKLKLRWLINDVKSKMVITPLTDDILKEYAGTFEEFIFVVENGKLFCINSSQRNKKTMMTAINDHLFKIDDESQAEFVRENDGMVKSFRLLWNDGWSDVIKKSK